MGKRRSIFMVITVTVMVALAGSPTVMARMHGMGPGLISFRALMELDVSDAQKALISAIMAESKPDRERARQKHDEARDIIVPVLEAETFNEENIRAAFRQASSLMEDITVIRAKVDNQIRAALTEAQRQILDDQSKKGETGMKRHAEFEETLLNAWLRTTSE